MSPSRRRFYALVSAGVLLAAIGSGAPPARAADIDCTQFGTTELQGSEYIYQQNEWNSTDRQCAEIDPATGAWSITEANFNLPVNGAPATYPASFKGCHWGLCT